MCMWIKFTVLRRQRGLYLVYYTSFCFNLQEQVKHLWPEHWQTNAAHRIGEFHSSWERVLTVWASGSGSRKGSCAFFLTRYQQIVFSAWLNIEKSVVSVLIDTPYSRWLCNWEICKVLFITASKSEHRHLNSLLINWSVRKSCQKYMQLVFEIVSIYSFGDKRIWKNINMFSLVCLYGSW